MGLAGVPGRSAEDEIERLRQRVAELESRLESASEARALEAAGLGAWELDLARGSVTASPQAYAICGLASPAPALAEWMECVHPEDRARVRGELTALAARGGSSESEYRVQPAPGVIRWVLSKARVAGAAGGRPARIVAVVQDITARKATEAELRQSRAELQLITDSVPALISYIDRDFRYQFVNRAYEEWFDRPRERCVGFRVAEVLGEEAFARLRPYMERALSGERVVYDGVAPYRTRTRHIHASYMPDRAPDGSVRGFAVLVEDITDRKAIEKHLSDQQKMEGIAMLAGGIAHDFNNLLVGVIGNASLLQDMLPRHDPAQEFLEQIVTAGEVAAHLTKQMLAYSGRGKFVLEQIDLSAVARQMVEMLRASISSKKIAVNLELEAALPPVEADRGQMEQVLMNLVFNAAEAIGDEPGVLTVRTASRRIDAPRVPESGVGSLRAGTYVALEVRDTGCGMDEATRARIFEPFFTTKFTGRGLGLPAVSGIVRGHNGALEVATAPGKGSRFAALFPAMAEETRACVLVVDGEEMVRTTARRCLERFGYRVLLAGGDAEAAALLEEHGNRIALVILDVGMPGKSGSETLAALLRVRPDVEVMVSSGYPEKEVFGGFSGLPIRGFLQKPFTSEQFQAKVAAALARG